MRNRQTQPSHPTPQATPESRPISYCQTPDKLTGIFVKNQCACSVVSWKHIRLAPDRHIQVKGERCSRSRIIARSDRDLRVPSCPNPDVKTCDRYSKLKKPRRLVTDRSTTRMPSISTGAYDLASLLQQSDRQAPHLDLTKSSMHTSSLITSI